VTLQANQRVRISGEAGTVIGRVEDISTVDEMPEFAELGFATAGESSWLNATSSIHRVSSRPRVSSLICVSTKGSSVELL